jgi:Zn-dependent protease
MTGVRIGRILGIPLRINWSVIAIFAVIVASLATAALPELAPGYNDFEYWTVGIVGALVFFGSLLAHELSHSVVARKRGVPVRDITLWLFGGVSTIEGEAHEPHDELMIALAGPAMSVALGIGSIASAGLTSAVGAPELIVGALAWLGSINLILAVFNLVPAAPLDGGRVLHAVLWRRRGDRTSAGITASHAGRIFGWTLVSFGMAEIWFLGAVSGVWLILLGWFLVSAARAEETQVIVLRDLDGVRVGDVMTPRVDVPAWQIPRLPVAQPGEPVLDVLRRAERTGHSRIIVVDDNELVGMVTPTEVSRAIQETEAEIAAKRVQR